MDWFTHQIYSDKLTDFTTNVDILNSLQAWNEINHYLVLSCLGYSPSKGSPTSLLIFRFDRRLKTFRLRLESTPSIHSYLVESSSLTIHFIPRTKGDPWIWVSSLLKFVELGVRLVLLPLHPPGGSSGHPNLVVHARRVSGKAVEKEGGLYFKLNHVTGVIVPKL